MMDKSERFDRDALIGALQEAGATFRGKECRCPFHDDKRASAGVYSTAGGVWRFKCQSCGASGDVFDIRARVRGVPLSAVLPREDKHSTPPKTPHRATPRVFGALEDIAANAGGRVEHIYPYSPEFAVIRIIAEDGKKSFRQVQKSQAGWVFGAPPKPWPLYGRESIGETEDPVIVTEGEKCVEALREIDMVAVTSPCGAGKASCADWAPLAGRNVVLWPDFDDVGRAHMADVAKILAGVAEHVRIIDPQSLGLPPKGDVADLLEMHAADSPETKRESIRKILKTARPSHPSGELVELVENTIAGVRRAISLPWLRLSKLARPLLPGSITLLCGSPGSGKSFLLLEAAYHLYSKGEAVALFALEESRADALLRLLAQQAGNSCLLDSEWIVANPEAAREALSCHCRNLDAFAERIYDAPDAQPTLDSLIAWTKARATEGVRVIVIDPISVADMGPEPWNFATRFMVEASRAIRGTGASLIVAAHPKKGAAIGGLVDLDSVSGGAAFVRLAQTVLWLERHSGDHVSKIGGMTGPHDVASNVTVHLLKTRHGPGQGARLAFEFNQDNLCFYEQGIIESSRRIDAKPRHE
jgi:hypothetical protein